MLKSSKETKRSNGAVSLNNGDISDYERSYNEQSPLLSDSRSSHLLIDPTSTEGIHDPEPDVQVEDGVVKLQEPKQSSLITIFSMWNTMMGTSLLSMPWAIKQAGYVNGIVMLIVMAGIMAYTSYRILVSGKSLVGMIVDDFCDVVREYLGRFAGVIALLCSLLTLIGGAIVYWILMSNFLYHIGVFIYSHTHKSNSNNHSSLLSTKQYDDVVCYNGSENLGPEDPTFKKVWDEQYTVPFFLIVLLFPLFNFKSPTFFTKFNALGTISVTYLTVFVAVKAGKWGMNLDLNPDHSHATDYSENFEWTFPALTGISALAYFLQNAVMAITKNQKNPQNNTRDLCIAYGLVCLTYTYMGSVFYAAFPLDKSCVADNYLNNIASTDIMAFVARLGLFFQMTCVLPLIMFIFRAQLLHFIFRNVYPGLKHVLSMNAVVVAVCLLFAVFYPKIGTIISFIGAFCGFSYAIAFPCVVYMLACRRDGTLTIPKAVFHVALIIFGFANFVAQFLIMGHTK